MKKNVHKNIRKRIYEFFSNLVYKIKSLSILKHMLAFYFFITIIGSVLLYLPISRHSSVSVNYIDALFTSASAFSDTGLVTLTTATTWTHVGQAIIAILILVGGIGWFALKIYFLNILFGRPISFSSRETLSAERGTNKSGDIRRIVKISVTILFILIIIATIILSLYFYFIKPDTNPFGIAGGVIDGKMIEETAYHDVGVSFRWGIFHAISGLNNAGFDIIGSHSLEPYYHKYGLQIILMSLFIIGGIGYPVIYDLYSWVKSKITKESFKWSLFTKISMTAYIIIATIGIGTTFLIETTRHTIGGHEAFWNSEKYGSKGDKIMALIFNTMSTRNAGFGTVEISDLSSATLMIYIIMMFIGSAPSSTAGGVRTTTISIICMGIWSKIRGKNSVRMFNRKIPDKTVTRSYVVVTTAVLLVIFISLIGMSSFKEFGGEIYQGLGENKHSYVHILFEVTSAFGTTGLSTGITSHLSTVTKFFLIILMFIGQLGVSSTLLVWDSKKNKFRKFGFVEQDVTTG